VTRRLRATSATFLFAATAAVATASEQRTWTGVISDSMCKRHHESGAEGQQTTDPDCTRDCVKGGSKYVLLVEDTVLAIVNQDQKQLAEHAGTRVLVRGTLQGDAIEIAAIEKAR
jgi:hypothetical protein